MLLVALLQGETLTGVKDLGVAGVFVLLALEKLVPLVVSSAKKRNGNAEPLTPAQLRAVVEDQADRELLRKIAQLQVSTAEAVRHMQIVLDHLEKLTERLAEGGD